MRLASVAREVRHESNASAFALAFSAALDSHDTTDPAEDGTTAAGVMATIVADTTNTTDTEEIS